MSAYFLKRAAAVACLCLISLPAMAEGGISIRGTRIIYPENSRQQSLSVNNSSATDSFLVQSWVEDASGHKSNNFVVTPPLYLSGPHNENTLRLVRAGGDLPQDKESLYYFVAKAIPSFDEKTEKAGNVLRVAAASRIKLFVRPSNLKPSPDQAPSLLEFRRADGRLDISNPTPYYITLVNIKIGGVELKDIMVAPKDHNSEALPRASGSTITFHVINDYGAITKEISSVIK
ncbi:hypothetical protein WS62_29685 [Burkholderia sp. ABCPW 14]|uniref:fimbria/pilus periplasmic chaperone n=1 Tax=Burkholderia sp. ABCPW 14 TaxID=1637860 RepID=UPI000770C7C0|nr:fimbria/pilus periplasmic chaperone [Burkholderia sp. ABCPW 14]KVD78000.1 hypothetical protein WS62_29685 [Burkholderia sp. ABCPW 14]